MIGMPEALAIMSLSGIVIAAIVTRKPREPKQTDGLVSFQSCTSCKTELTRRIDERSKETTGIFRELKRQGKQLARIEVKLKIDPPIESDEDEE